MVDCSVEHLVDITFKDMCGPSMHVSQHPNFSLIKATLFRVYSISDECLLILSSKISKGDGSSEVVVSQYF